MILTRLTNGGKIPEEYRLQYVLEKERSGESGKNALLFAEKS
jgi:hypothetical protein